MTWKDTINKKDTSFEKMKLTRNQKKNALKKIYQQLEILFNGQTMSLRTYDEIRDLLEKIEPMENLIGD